MFRSEAQQARACRALCARARLGAMWTASRPTEEPIALYEAGGGPLSSGERIMLLVAWAFWNGAEKATLADVVNRLDERNLHAISTLMLALAHGAEHVDAWIEEMERGERR